ncbi:MFS transporter [Rhodococcus sp. 06-156-3C]|uniref:MFS transporter n=1 Tax=Nocardiaceae TaxID=85025 RepID=UPI000522E565|nr:MULTISPECIES: MFS transporter [Rhodococcus]OZD13115.1 MFS transporter [Rhodococcus sp. 06-156-4a]OZD17984.1 MFS transporter [Rhodococcus sp. 06-156-3C]OZD20708.1 MFS transporter [Rhodococcus sp. 06-156-4C]OZD30572.1 MFS transporter [Rhodococcus sp. 06-156-3b]OZD32654.1 MFS transporter [Rhodococcus sp. 06-156-3]
MSRTGETTPTRRNALRLLADRRFGSYFLGRLLTATGTWLHSLVAAIAVFGLTGSATAVGLVSLVQFAPQLILGPVSGKWSDRGSIKRQLMLGRGFSFVGSASLAVWFALVGDATGWGSASWVIGFSFIVGIGLVVGGPAMQSTVPLLVSRDELPAAMALNTTPITIGRVAGPALGAVVAASIGYQYAFAIAAVCHLTFIAIVSMIAIPPPEGRVDGDNYAIRDGLSFVRNDRPTFRILLTVTALGFGSEPMITLAPSLGDALGGGTHTVGALTASMGIGAAVGTVLTAALATRIRQDAMSTIGVVLMAVGLGGCAAPIGTWLSMVAFGITGFGFLVAVTCLSTVLQLRLPPVLRGRVMALWLMGFVGARPVGALSIGALADWTAVHIAFGAVAVAMFGAAWICRPSTLRGPSEATEST